MEPVKTVLSPLAAHFKRKADFMEQEAQALAMMLEQELAKSSAPVTIPEAEKDGE